MIGKLFVNYYSIISKNTPFCKKKTASKKDQNTILNAAFFSNKTIII